MIQSKIKTIPFHLILLSLYPFLSLYASNQTVVRVSDMVRPILIVLGIVGGVYLVIHITKIEMNRAAAFASIVILLFLSYGHIYSVIKGITVFEFTIGRHRYLGLAFVLLVIGTGVLIGVKTNNEYRLTRNLNIISSIVILIPVLSVGYFQFLNLISFQTVDTSQSESTAAALEWEELPDVYYIILDGYAREDILNDQYGYDNSAFSDFLEGNGFYIADESVSNFLWTMYSLSSSMNMDFAQNLGVRMKPSPDHYGFFEKIKHSLVRSKLEDLGYSTVAFSTGWDGSEMVSADYYMPVEESILSHVRTSGAFNNFESMIIYNSLFRILFDFDRLLNTRLGLFITENMNQAYDAKRAIVNSIFDNLKKVHQIPEPKFVFAHIVAPHRPYIFGPNGEAVYSPQPYTLSDLDDLPGDEEGILYLAQLSYISKQVEETVAEIISKSDRPVIIILQSDHGPMVGLNWDQPTRKGLEARMSILSAFYAPEACQKFFYPQITPVNIFQIIFHCVYGEPLNPREDVTFINKKGITSGFTPVEDILSEIE